MTRVFRNNEGKKRRAAGKKLYSSKILSGGPPLLPPNLLDLSRIPTTTLTYYNLIIHRLVDPILCRNISRPVGKVVTPTAPSLRLFVSSSLRPFVPPSISRPI